MTTTEIRMSDDLKRLHLLLRAHVGKENAISMEKLYEFWSGDAEHKQGVATASRYMRALIDDLIELHGVPVLSSSSGGYWIAANDVEVRQACAEFRSRGLRSLTKSARLQRITIAEEVEQLGLDLRRTA